jgi:hypothetical protein
MEGFLYSPSYESFCTGSVYATFVVENFLSVLHCNYAEFSKYGFYDLVRLICDMSQIL